MIKTLTNLLKKIFTPVKIGVDLQADSVNPFSIIYTSLIIYIGFSLILAFIFWQVPPILVLRILMLCVLYIFGFQYYSNKNRFNL